MSLELHTNLLKQFYGFNKDDSKNSIFLTSSKGIETYENVFDKRLSTQSVVSDDKDKVNYY